MTTEASAGPPLWGGLERVGNLVELLTTLDKRILAALDGLEEMRTSISTLDGLAQDTDELRADIQRRAELLDARLHRDLDELKEVILAKLGELDLSGVGPRLQRLEEAIFNIEKATINLDRSFEGGLEILPDFLTKRVKNAGRKEAPMPTGDGPGPLTS